MTHRSCLLHGGGRRWQIRWPLAAAAMASFTCSMFAAEVETLALVSLPRVEITGSNFRFAGDETVGPLQILTRKDIDRSGHTTLSDLLRSLTSDNSGSLSQSFAGAFAGGSSGVALRGMSVNATLVLIDGRRTTVYPLGDDGQRLFVDLSSLPLAIVERVEVLKDGASAIYGSDAIAGVVNIVLRPEFRGVASSLQTGISSRGDGTQLAASATWGSGDLDSDGRNVYVHIEGRRQSAVLQNDRPGRLSNLDLRGIGGSDLRGGIIQPGNAPPSNFAQTLVGMVAPLDSGNAQAGPFQLLPGCAPADLNYSGGCTWDTLRHAQIQPATQNLNLSARWTQRLPQGWKVGIDLQAAGSWSEQFVAPTYVPQGTQTDPSTSGVILPASHPDNPFGPTRSAFLYYTFGDVGPRHTTYRTELLRNVITAGGSLAAWDVEIGGGFARALTHVRYEGMVRTSALESLLASGQYRVGANAGLNSPAVYAELAPVTSDVASTLLQFVDLRASRELMALPGGPMALGAGIEVRRQAIDNPGQPFALEGDVLGNATAFARGSRSVRSLYGELQAPITRELDTNFALRLEQHAGIGTSTAPKAGMRWQALSGLALRGTYSRGFRVPSIVESANSALNFYTNFNDPARCPVTNLPSDCNGVVRLSISGNPALKPETSTASTLGMVLQPARDTTLTLDFYRIARKGEIVTAPFSGATTVYGGPDLANPQLPSPIVGFTLPFVNATSTVTTGFDLDARHRQQFGDFGRGTVRLQYTRILRYRQEVDGTTYEFAGTHGPTSLSGNVGTPAHRAQASLVWERGRLELGTNADYVSGMSATDPTIGSACLAQESNPRCRIASFTTVGLFGTWHIHKDLELGAHVRNLLDRRPPLDTVTYGGVNYNPSLHQAGAIGRFFVIGLRYQTD